MRWRLFATLGEAVGTNEVSVPTERENPTLRDAVDALMETQPELEALVLDEHGELQSHITLLYDGTDPFREADGWETPVADDRELALFPPVTGG